MLHHDAITGTNTEQTYNDYVQRIWSVNELLKEIWASIFEMIQKSKDSKTENHIFNETVSVFTAYNPSLYIRNEVLNFTAECESVSDLFDENGKSVYGEYVNILN